MFDQKLIRLLKSLSGQKVLDLGEVIAKQSGTALDEVVVKGKRAVYTQKGDGTLLVNE